VWIVWRVGGAFWIDDVTFECMGPRGVWGGLQECGFLGGGTMTGQDVRDSRHPLDNIGECAGLFFSLFFSCPSRRPLDTTGECAGLFRGV
jgi:hypothetical protein